jgi:NAD(P)-dependent dehydrogenase (short-subunit alcohol dehydrogenase family)
MYERSKGKIVVYGSATGIRAQEGVLAYGAARAAQVGYVRSLGVEAARHNVQINLIAQHFVPGDARVQGRIGKSATWKTGEG